ncbi:MAG: glycosyltransferase family 4 protein [Parafilimonas sp.]
MYKIVQMVPALGWGGAQVFCIQLCNELAKDTNNEVTLISMYHHLPEKHLPLSMLSDKVKFISLGKKPGIDPRIFLRIYKTLKNIKPDVVHTHLHSGYYCFYAYTRLKYPYKKIHTLHNLAKKDAPPHGRKMFKYFFRKNIIEAVTISEEVHKSAVEEYGTCIKTLIHNGSDEVKPSSAFKETKEKTNSLKKNATTKVLLNVARISKQKNQMLLLDVMYLVKEQNVIAIILGDYVAEDKNIYDALMAAKPDNVFFAGKVTNVSDYLLCADAFVLTSTFEGLPISLLEALCAGAVPVCTPVGGIINIVSKDIGFLSKDVNKDAYLKALQSYLNTDDAAIEQLKRNGKDLYNKEYSMKTCAAKYNALYHSS